MIKMKIKKGDKVVVTSGRSKGDTGEVLLVDKKRSRVFVKGVHLVLKHAKPSAKNPKGGRVSKESSLHSSNVAHLDIKTNLPTRVGVRFEDGKRVLFSKRSGEKIRSWGGE